jgi:ubiquinone/menaquinone biosynthesis C-methylase UbiE
MEKDHSAHAANIFNELADLYAQKYMDASQYHQSFDEFCGTITERDAHILELACGPGNITKYLKKVRPDFQILATDLAPKMLEIAKKNNPAVLFQILDSRDILSLNEKFDAIMIGFLLPYLSKDETLQLIKDAGKILNQNGVIYLSTMEGVYENSNYHHSSNKNAESIYMHYYNEDLLTKILKSNGFDVIYLNYQPIDNSENKDDLIIIAQKY